MCCISHCHGQSCPLRKGSSWVCAGTCRCAVCTCRLLAVDSRNFLAWAYRRFAVERACVPLEDEEQYSMDCINANFSNYSAWHARTVLLPHIHAAQPTTSLADLLAADSAPNQAAALGVYKGHEQDTHLRSPDIHNSVRPQLHMCMACRAFVVAHLLQYKISLSSIGTCCAGCLRHRAICHLLLDCN